MRDGSSLFFSLRPRYADQILAGTKTVELRRVRPNVVNGCHVLLYAASPRMELVGTATVGAIDVGTLDEIWARHGDATGIDRETFDAYFVGRETAIAIELEGAKPLTQTMPLAELRQRVIGFRPPQSFRYFASSEVALMV